MITDEFKWIYSDDAAPRRLSNREILALKIAREKLKRGLRMRESWTESMFAAEELRLRREIINFIDARDRDLAAAAAAQTETDTEARAA